MKLYELHILHCAFSAIHHSDTVAVVAFFGVWMIARAIHGEYDVTAMHMLMLAYFAHLLARALWLQLRYRKAVLEKPFARA